EMMNAAGYRFVSTPTSRTVRVNRSPAAILEDEIRALTTGDRPVSQVYLNIAGHGFAGGVRFHYTSDGREDFSDLTPQQLKVLFSKFPKVKFVLSTVACLGGGYAGALKDYRDPTGEQGRVVAFLQSKGYGTNQEGRIKGEVGVNGAP